MPDKLTDLYPIPVNFVPGQQPTAAFLNAWAEQIDAAFDVVSRILGDLPAEDSSTNLAAQNKDTGYRGQSFATNLTRLIGNVGWLNPRLPDTVNADIQENLGAFVGKKEILLSFPPSAIVQESRFVTDKEVTPWPDGFSSHADADAWMRNGRQIRLIGAIENDEWIRYSIDASDDTYREGVGNNSGHTLVPSLPQIANISSTFHGQLPYCTLTLDPGSSTSGVIEFPTITHVMSHQADPPLGLAANIILRIRAPDEVMIATSLRWVNTAPKYSIPAWIEDLIGGSPGAVLPEGLIALWEATEVNNIIEIRRLNTGIEGVFIFKKGADRYEIKVEAPDGIVLENGNNYILAFAGTSIAETTAYNKIKIASHKHDGTDESSPIDAASLKNRFDHTNYTHSVIDGNHFPQYLHRGGYTPSDSLNGHNVLLGDLVLGGASFFESDLATPVAPEDYADNQLTAPSRSIYFGNAQASSAPRLTWKDISTEGLMEDDFISGANLVLDNLINEAAPWNPLAGLSGLLIRSGELYLGSNTPTSAVTKGKIVFSPHSAEAPNSGGWTEPTAKKNLVLQFNAGTVVAADAAIKQYKRLSLLTNPIGNNALERTGTELEVGRIIADTIAADTIAADIYEASAEGTFKRFIAATDFEYADAGASAGALESLLMFNPLFLNYYNFWENTAQQAPESAHAVPANPVTGGPSDHLAGDWEDGDAGPPQEYVPSSKWVSARKYTARQMYREGRWMVHHGLNTANPQPAAMKLTFLQWLGPLSHDRSFTAGAQTHANIEDFIVNGDSAQLSLRLDRVMPSLLSDALAAHDASGKLEVSKLTLYYEMDHNDGEAFGSQKTWFGGSDNNGGYLAEVLPNLFYSNDSWTGDGGAPELVYAKNEVPNKRVFEIEVLTGTSAGMFLGEPVGLNHGVFTQVFHSDSTVLDLTEIAGNASDTPFPPRSVSWDGTDSTPEPIRSAFPIKTSILEDGETRPVSILIHMKFRIPFIKIYGLGVEFKATLL